jgi:hypothetical protein
MRVTSRHMRPRILGIAGDRLTGQRQRQFKFFATLRPAELDARSMGPGEKAVGARIVRGDLERLAETGLSNIDLVGRPPSPHKEHRPHHQSPGVEAFGRAMGEPAMLGGVETRFDRASHAFGNLILQSEEVGNLDVVALGPDLELGRGVHQLSGDPSALSGAPHRALQNIAHSEIDPDLLNADGLSLVGEGRIASADEEAAHARKPRNNIFGEPVGEEFLLNVAA